MSEIAVVLNGSLMLCSNFNTTPVSADLALALGTSNFACASACQIFYLFLFLYLRSIFDPKREAGQ